MATLTDTLVTVSVTVTTDIHGNPRVTCTPSEADVLVPGTTLQFNLATTGWAFPTTDPVYVDPPDLNNFPYPSAWVNSTQCTLYDAYTSTGLFSYLVTVQHTTTGQVLKHDPTIRNGN